MSRPDDTLPPLAAPARPVPDDATVLDAAPLVVEAVDAVTDPHRAATRAITGATAGLTVLGRRPVAEPARAPSASPVSRKAPAAPGVPAPAGARPPPRSVDRAPAVVPPRTRATGPTLAPDSRLPAAPALAAPPVAPPAFVPAPLPVAAVQPRSARTLPTRGRVLIGLGVGFLVLMVIASRGGDKDMSPSLQVQDDIVVSHEDLKKRTEVRPEDFGPRGPRLRVAPPPAPAAAASAGGVAVSDEELEARRQRRGSDPEDLHASARNNRLARPAVSSFSPAEAPEESDSLYLEPRAVKAPPGQKSSSTKGTGSRDSGAIVVRAGTTLAGRLDGPVVTASGGSTAVVEITAPDELAGARLVGSASYSQGRVVMRFRTLLLASGQEVDVRAEARDSDGAFGLAVVAPSDSSSDPSVEAQVAEEAGTGLVAGAIGGLGGSVVSDYARKKRQGGSKPSYGTPSVTVEAGRELQVFVSETARQ